MLFKKLLFLFIFLTQLVFAQWPTSVDSGLFVDYGIYPYLIKDKTENSFFVAYIVNGQIRVKKYDQFGYAQWNDEAAIVTDTTNGQTIQDMANNGDGQWGGVISDGDGGIIVHWEDYRNATLWDGWFPDAGEIFVQRIDKDGNAVYQKHGKKVSSNRFGNYRLGDVKADNNGGFYLVFTYEDTDTNSSLKRFDLNGNLLWEKFFNELFIEVCASSKKGDVYYNYKQNGLVSRQRTDLNGHNYWPDTLSGAIPHDWLMRHGGAFADDTGIIGVGGGGYLTIQRVDSSGEYAWDEIDLGLGQFGRLQYASDGEGGIFVSWNGIGVLMQHITQHGEIAFDEHLQITEDDPSGVKGVISDEEGGAITIWGRNQNDITSLYSQLIDSNGIFLWGDKGILLHTTEEELTFDISPIPIQPDGYGGAVYIWAECCFGNRLYLKQISHEGKLGDVVSRLEKNLRPAIKNFNLFQNSPNPFNPKTNIRFELPEISDIQIDIFNIQGQLIKTIKRVSLNPGQKEISWNGKNSVGNSVASGLYIYRLNAQSVRDKSKGYSKYSKMLLLR